MPLLEKAVRFLQTITLFHFIITMTFWFFQEQIKGRFGPYNLLRCQSLGVSKALNAGCLSAKQAPERRPLLALALKPRFVTDGAPLELQPSIEKVWFVSERRGTDKTKKSTNKGGDAGWAHVYLL